MYSNSETKDQNFKFVLPLKLETKYLKPQHGMLKTKIKDLSNGDQIPDHVQTQAQTWN